MFRPLTLAKSFNKTPSQFWLGVFVSAVCLFSATVFAEKRCSAVEPVEWAELKKIVDGDTLYLQDGRKVRVMGINTPEVGFSKKHGQTDPQPLATEAKQAAENFFGKDSKVGLRYGQQRVDRYGRTLASVYRSSGASLSAYLLEFGLAWQVVVPPNDIDWRCLAAIEGAAKKQRVGLWNKHYDPTKPANSLGINDTGFQRITGKVVAVNRSRGGWWLQLGDLAIRVQEKNLKYLNKANPEDWLNKTLTVRGWVIDRSQSSAVVKKGYSPLMMNLQHAAMLK